MASMPDPLETQGETHPLTPMQEGLLFHAIYERSSRAYHEHLLFDLEGPLEAAVLRGAFETICSRRLSAATTRSTEGSPLSPSHGSRSTTSSAGFASRMSQRPRHSGAKSSTGSMAPHPSFWRPRSSQRADSPSISSCSPRMRRRGSSPAHASMG